MRGLCFVVILIFINKCDCTFWKKGIVYYTINKLDYDLHSQDEITSTLAKLENEVCVKFFQQPPGNRTIDNKLLFISNPDKVKNCQPNIYDFSNDVIVMPIGYKCLYEKGIARIVMEMLRASIEKTVSRTNSFDLIQKFQDKDTNQSLSTLLAPDDRNFINAHYHAECGERSQRVARPARRENDDEQASQLTDDNVQYYRDKLWPLGIVMYGVEEGLRDSEDHNFLRKAMSAIELVSCVVFEEIQDDLGLTPKNLLWFGSRGDETPFTGFKEGNQTISLERMVRGAPGHTAHALNNLMRTLGVDMMSNRHDRNNYVNINWKNVVRGKERLLDKSPRAAWLEQIAYDFNSVTHAPANFACRACQLGAATVQPLQDLLWQRTMAMGHSTELSQADKDVLKILYAKQCRDRFGSDDNKE